MWAARVGVSGTGRSTGTFFFGLIFLHVRWDMNCHGVTYNIPREQKKTGTHKAQPGPLQLRMGKKRGIEGPPEVK
jgi:hypothetical protein